MKARLKQSDGKINCIVKSLLPCVIPKHTIQNIKSEKLPSKQIFPVYFHNTFFDFIHLGQTLRDEKLTSKLQKSLKMAKHRLLFPILGVLLL